MIHIDYCIIRHVVKLDSCVRRYLVYKHNWTARIDEVLPCARESGNKEDPYAVAIKKDGCVVGQVLQAISCIFSIFMRIHGVITCTIIATRRFSSDLPQGGLELPCEYTFTGSEDIIRTSRQCFIEEKMTVSEIVAVQFEDKSLSTSTSNSNPFDTNEVLEDK